ncbi:hypothetical protein [Deinococcus humi]|uniref:Lipoprotein n=1 Tax=Deinococcus humi TaxID=662880 RepID=A0A7W8NI03_9DEIO|nr:hypothetical protein [Deinococcus humi]MBB5366420.1 hypothetical protein [Deinococcus humi]GGO41892.1 hypothetical protein GCM10008949_53290 [Deinococcus humi]
MKTSPGLVLLPVLLLAACTPKETPAGGETVNTLSGTAVEGQYAAQGNQVVLQTSAWTGGAGNVTLNVLDAAGKTVELGRTALGADGKFSFASLPTPNTSELTKITEQSESCTNTFVVSDPAALNATAGLFASAQTNVPLTLVAYDTTTAGGTTTRTGTLIYADRAVTVKGSQTCQIGAKPYTADFNLALVKGWNMTTASLNLTTRAGTVRNGAPAGAQWIAFKVSGGATGLAVNGFLLR